MLKHEQFEGTPMCDALTELAGKMRDRDMPPVELNVIGGFALMLRQVRPASGVTDIDYVGRDLPYDFNAIADEVGVKHGLGDGWINNTVMLSGAGMDDFTLSTGELHFDHAFDVGGIKINVLDEKDLLRMKIIALDTALMEIDATGDFARAKDLPDIKAMMDRQGLDMAGIDREFGQYILCRPDTLDVIRELHEKSPDKARQSIDLRKQAVVERNAAMKARREAAAKARGDAGPREESPFLSDLMGSLMKKAKQRSDLDDLDFPG